MRRRIRRPARSTFHPIPLREQTNRRGSTIAPNPQQKQPFPALFGVVSVSNAERLLYPPWPPD